MKPNQLSNEPKAIDLLREYIDAQISYRLTGYLQYTESISAVRQEAERIWQDFVAALEAEVEESSG